MNKEIEVENLVAPGRAKRHLLFIGGWALLINGFLTVAGSVITGGDAFLFLVPGMVGSILFLVGLPAIWALQPQIGRVGQAGLYCLGIGAGIALIVQALSLTGHAPVGDFVPLISAICGLLGSAIVGWVTIRAGVFPAIAGWLLIIAGVLNLVTGLAFSDSLLLGIISSLVEAAAVVSYALAIIKITR